MSDEVKALVKELVDDALDYDGLIISINETDGSEIRIQEDYSLIDETIFLGDIEAETRLTEVLNELHEKLDYE